MNLFYWKSFT